MQYLDIVNKVLIRLRETEVTTVTQDDYSTLIGEFVNDAKQEVEDAFNWDCLNQILTVTTVASQAEYSLTGSGNRFQLWWILDNNKDQLKQKDRLWYYKQETLLSQPHYYVFTGQDGSGDQKVTFYPTPDTGSLNFQVSIKIPQADLSNDTDTLTVPSEPVIWGAYARAIGERGEDGGISRTEAETLYRRALSDAIAFEAGRFPEYTTFYEV